MNEQVKIKISVLIGSRLCISAQDGQRVYDKIAESIKAGKQVTVSFENIKMLVSLFLNVAIGQLYGTFEEETIREQLKVKGLEQDDLELLKMVVDNAKKYYSNRNSYDKAWEEEEYMHDEE